MSEGKRKRERERNTLIHFSWLLAAAEPAGPEREREGEGWIGEKEVFFSFSRYKLISTLFFFFFFWCPRMFTKLHREGQTEGFFSIDACCSSYFKVLLLVVNWSSQLSAEFRPLLLTTCNSVEQSLIAQKESPLVQLTRCQEPGNMSAPRGSRGAWWCRPQWQHICILHILDAACWVCDVMPLSIMPWQPARGQVLEVMSAGSQSSARDCSSGSRKRRKYNPIKSS